MTTTKYVSKKADSFGICHYTPYENQTWQILYERQIKIIENRACNQFLEGLSILNMSPTYIPQCFEMNETLQKRTGWSVVPVPALISSNKFFKMLANRKFPAATFIRNREELDYLTEPDIFHEFFGHCPLLTNPHYAEFVEQYGKLSLKVTPQEQKKLLRLFWLTIEFGLIQTKKGLRIYGGGILSSNSETIYALESKSANRLPFNILDSFRTPYRIDIKQPIYYIISNIKMLYDILQMDIITSVHQAISLGDFTPEFSQSTDGSIN